MSVRYVLITPVHNEGSFVANTLNAVVSQTALPHRWVIVNDGSTDRTSEIIERYTRRYLWIDLINLPQRPNRSFAAKAEAVTLGLQRLVSTRFDVIGNLDGDVSFEP